MSILQVLWQKEVAIFKNSYLKTKKQLFTSVGMLLVGLLAVGLLAMVGFTAIFRSAILSLTEAMPMLSPEAVYTLLFYLLLVWFSFTILGAMLQEVQPEFYQSPELNFLISTPVAAATLFVSRFVKMTYFSKSSLSSVVFFGLPSMLSLGVMASAPWYYYLFILPVVYLFLIIPASLGISLSMFLLRFLSAKRIMQAAAVINTLSTVVWFAFIWGGEEVLPQIFGWLEKAGPFLAFIFPLAEAVNALTAFLQGDVGAALGPLARLFLSSGVIFAVAMLVARQVYYAGYDRSQTVEGNMGRRSKNRRKKTFSAQKQSKIWHGRKANLVLTEWKKALRNYEMGQGAIGMLAMLVGYLVVITRMELSETWTVLLAVLHIGVLGFLVSGMVAMFFVPAAFMKKQDKKILKEQHVLAKTMPFRRGEFLQGYWLALFIPQVIIGGVALALVNIFTGSSVAVIVVSVLALSVLFGTMNIFDIALDMLGYSQQEESVTLLLRIGRSILPFVYYIVALGVLALGQVYSHLGFMRFIHHWSPSTGMAVSGALFLILSGVIFYYSLRMGTKYWEEMEI